MLHLTVPETARLFESNGSWHDAFKIHVNGSFHCNLRYSGLLKLHDSLGKNFANDPVFSKLDFPPKKIKYLMSEKELEERRDLLEAYLRCLSQNHIIANSSIVSNFFRDAQKETILIDNQEEIETQLTVYLPDSTKTLIHCTPGDSTSLILERISGKIGVAVYIIRHFGLFIVSKSPTNPYKIIRWLQDFECPSISLYYAQKMLGKKSVKIILRRSYWSLEIDKELTADRSALNLLYSQAMSEADFWSIDENLECNVTHHWSQSSDDFLQKLKHLQTEREFTDIVKLCQQHHRYGLLYFEDCTSDYPVQGTKIKLAIGNCHVFLLYQIKDAGPFVESSFRVNRIRCWKLHNRENESGVGKISLEYLVNRDNLQWITVFSDQNVLISLCLQSMVNEMVSKSTKQTTPTPVDDFTPQKPALKNPQVSSSSGKSSCGDSAYSTCESINASLDSLSINNIKTPSPLIKSYRSKSISSSSFDNDAFNTITDEDL